MTIMTSSYLAFPQLSPQLLPLVVPLLHKIFRIIYSWSILVFFAPDKKSFSASRLLLPISIKKILRHSASWTILQITSVLFFSHKSILYIPRKSVTINQVAAAGSAFILKRPNKAMACSRFICLNSISLTSFFSHVVFSHPNFSDFAWRNFSLPSSLLDLYL